MVGYSWGFFLLFLLLLLFRVFFFVLFFFLLFWFFFFFRISCSSTLYSSCPKRLRLKETLGGGALAQWFETLTFPQH